MYETISAEFPSLGSKSPGIRRWLRPILWHSPYLYWAFGILRQKKNILSPGFDLLIDGFPRSANTFAAFAFHAAQRSPVRISSHHHNPAAVIASVQMKKPTLVLLRDPVDAVASWTIFSGYPIGYNLACYINYYKELLPYSDRFVVGAFEQVTMKFSEVISELNAKFGTRFDLPDHDSIDHAAIFQKIDIVNAETNGGIDEARVSRPSALRQDQKQRVLRLLTQSEFVDSLEEARSLGDRLRGLSGRHRT